MGNKMETIDLTKDQKLAYKIASRSMYGTFSNIHPEFQYGHGWNSEKVEEFENILSEILEKRLEFKKSKNEINKEESKG